MSPNAAERACRVGATVLMALGLSACGIWRPVSVPIPTTLSAAGCEAARADLLVLLPGSFSRPEEFVAEGFVAAVRERHIAADILLVDAHLGYYADKSIIDRLQADVIEPARARGVRRIWLVGISIGAFGAMITANAQAPDRTGAIVGTASNKTPDLIAGIIALGPYLGTRSVQNQIVAAGGLQRWSAPVGPLGDDEIDAALWRWLQRQSAAAAASPSDAGMPVYLGYGRSDRFRFGDELLAAALPAERVFTEDGGHDWAPWLALWKRILDAVPLPREAGCTGVAPAVG